MIDMAVLIHQLIQLFLIICIGFIAFKVKILNESANRAINKLILDITLPCMMINSVLSMKEKPPISSVTLLFVTAVIFYLVMPLLAFIVVKIMMKAMHVQKSRQGAYMFMLIFSNIAFMGFPILQAACGNLGDTAVFYAAVLNIFFNISAFTYGVIMIGYGNTKKTAFKLKSLLSPGIIASLLAIIIYGFNISFPSLISNVIYTVGELTSPLAMIMVGASLASIKLNEIFNEGEVYVFP